MYLNGEGRPQRFMSKIHKACAPWAELAIFIYLSPKIKK